MKPPESLLPLVEDGLIQDVIRPLRSGKEAQVYLVLSDGEERVAKVYKESHQRTFKNRSQYTEGRGSRNTRDQRAMKSQSKYGKSKDEAAWRSTEADIIYRLRAAEVQVPEPFAFSDNVLIMELVRDAEGRPAPRLADISPSPQEAQRIYDHLVAETVKMLCAGVVHGDLSEFNVLLGAEGPVIIDFPQALDPSTNNNAKRILLRDVGNLDRFLAKHHRSRRYTRYGHEMWDHFEKLSLAPDMKLTGKAPKPKGGQADVDSLLAEIQEMERASRERRAALGLPPPRTARAPIFKTPAPPPSTSAKGPDKAVAAPRGRRRGGRARGNAPSAASGSTSGSNAPSANAPRSNAPSANAPRSNAPSANAPRSNAPRSNAPRSNAPRSNAPRSNPPANGATPAAALSSPGEGPAKPNKRRRRRRGRKPGTASSEPG